MQAQEITKGHLSFFEKHFLTLQDFDKTEIEYLIKLGLELKNKQKKGIPFKKLKDKTLAMIFEKSSTRTRVSFEIGMLQLGGSSLFLSQKDLQLGRGETIGDTAKVLSRYVDGIMMRTDSQEKLEELAVFSTVPVINGLSDLYHPTQAIADFLTIYEYKHQLQGIKLAYIGDGNNVAHSLIIAGAKLGLDVYVATPKGYEPNVRIVEQAKKDAKGCGGKVIVTNNPIEAVSNADVIYTDVWASMGHEEEKEIRLKLFENYQVNQNLVKEAKDDFIFMHCLPAHRGEEVTADIIDGKHSVVYDEAENRLHAHKAILTTFMS